MNKKQCELFASTCRHLGQAIITLGQAFEALDFEPDADALEDDTPTDPPAGASQSAVDAMEASVPPTKWVTFKLILDAPIGRPKALRIIERVAPNPAAKRQLEFHMGQGTGTKQAVVYFTVKVTDRDGDAMELAKVMANRMDQYGSDGRARAKVSQVVRM